MSHSLLMTLSDCWQLAPLKREVELTTPIPRQCSWRCVPVSPTLMALNPVPGEAGNPLGFVYQPRQSKRCPLHRGLGSWEGSAGAGPDPFVRFFFWAYCYRQRCVVACFARILPFASCWGCGRGQRMAGLSSLSISFSQLDELLVDV